VAVGGWLVGWLVVSLKKENKKKQEKTPLFNLDVGEEQRVLFEHGLEVALEEGQRRE
jgi:hypothetical protein